LTFHALDRRQSVISFSPDLFQRGIARLYESGYRTLSLLDAVVHLRQGQSFPPRTLVLTFDDGYQSVYDEAFPVLARYGLSATIFLCAGEGTTATSTARLPSLSGRSMLAWREIREMHRWGIDFGAHTVTHPDLTRLPGARVRAEMRDSQALIEDALGVGVECFAYPYGRHDRQSREIARGLFACACSDTLGLVDHGTDLYALKRVDSYYLRTDRLFGLIGSGWFPWYIWARGIPRTMKRLADLRPAGGS
jgi:peptidoglycan/xylan/chitin deacetylase (PgdA/CDA1 family)